MADPGVPQPQSSNGPTSGPPSGKSMQNLASPRKQGRFLIIEPPRLEEEEELLDSSSTISVSPPAAYGAASADIQARFVKATTLDSAHRQQLGVNGGATGGGAMQNFGSQKTDTASSGASSGRVPSPPTSTGAPQAFVVKNTDGPLFDPAMAAAFGWSEDESASDTSSESLTASMSLSQPGTLLPPMSTYGSGQVPQRERERMRREWLQNIVFYKQEQDRILAENQRTLAEKMKALQEQRAAAAATSSSPPSSSAVSPRDRNGSGTSTHSNNEHGATSLLAQVPTANSQTGYASYNPFAPSSTSHIDPSTTATSKSPNKSPSVPSSPRHMIQQPHEEYDLTRKLSTSSSTSAHHTTSTSSATTTATNNQLPVLDLATYQASKVRLSVEPPNSGSAPTAAGSVIETERRIGHRRSASDISIEARMHARRESGPPPPRPMEGPEVSRVSPKSPRNKKNGKSPDGKGKHSKKNLDSSSSHPERVTIDSSFSASRSESNLSASDRSISGASPTPSKKVRIQEGEGKMSRGRSASVSKKIGGFIGRIFETKPKDKHESDKPTKKHSKSLLNASTSSVTPGTSSLSVSAASIGEESAESSSLANHAAVAVASAPPSTDSLFSSSASSESFSPGSSVSSASTLITSSAPQLNGASYASSAPNLGIPNTLNTSAPSFASSSVPTLSSSSNSNPNQQIHGTSSVSSTSEITVPTNKASRPKPPIPPKPNIVLRHAKTMRPSTTTKSEFGLDGEH